VATLPPLADLAAQVAGERGAVASLVPPGADSHTYEPRPSDVAELEAADAYFGGGLGLDHGMLELAETTLGEGAPVVRLGEVVLDEADLAGAPGGREPDHDHGGDGGHAAGPNPHTWMSVPLARAKVEVIAEVLAELDPDAAEAYRENARAYREALGDLHASIEEAAATVPTDRRTLVTFHEAHAYFAADYGFELVGAIQPSDVSEPTAADVAALIEQIEAHDVPAVFGSRAFPDDVTEQIAAETGATYHGGLSDDVLPGEPGEPAHSYLGLMAHNARVIVGGLGGDAERVAEPGESGRAVTRP
jgi:ABC-type Zn uptake system ZnuABC Zn-binding protein ZnuA